VSASPDGADPAAAHPTPGRIAGRARRPIERVIELALVSCGLVAILATIGIVVVIGDEAIAFFSEVSFGEFFGDTRWTPMFTDNQHFGIWPLISGTLMTSAIAMLVAIPFGLLAAIYMSEFAAPRTRRLLKPGLELLAGIPTVVFGYFALTVITPALQKVIPGLNGFNALSPSIVMGVMIIPLVASLSEDAIYAVPNSLREASYSLGAPKVYTIFHVILPAASSGIAAALTLAASRAVGETMILAIAAGQNAQLSIDPRNPMQTMTAFIAQVANGDLPAGSIGYRSIFAVGATLFVFTLALNVLSYRWSRGLRAQARAV
jgi:phosphate transport system permease protein